MRWELSLSFKGNGDIRNKGIIKPVSLVKSDKNFFGNNLKYSLNKFGECSSAKRGVFVYLSHVGKSYGHLTSVLKEKEKMSLIHDSARVN